MKIVPLVMKALMGGYHIQLMEGMAAKQKTRGLDLPGSPYVTTQLTSIIEWDSVSVLY